VEYVIDTSVCWVLENGEGIEYGGYRKAVSPSDVKSQNDSIEPQMYWCMYEYIVLSLESRPLVRLQY